MTEEKKPIKDALEELSDILNQAQEDNEKYLAEILEQTPYEVKVAVTAWAIKHILEHAREGGTYRYLIYDRLGFGPDAYGILQMAGALEISNEFDIERMDNIKEHVRGHKIESIKPLIGFCDEPGCFDDASSGFPTDNGYRWTCYKHWEKLKQ